MYKFVVLSVVALVASVSGAPGGLVVPVVASAPSVAIAHPVSVSSSYSNTYKAPVVKAVPVIAAASTHQLVHQVPVVASSHPVVATPLVAAHPVVKTTHQVVAHPSTTIVKTAPLVAHSPIAVAHTPIVHAAPITPVHGIPISGYANHYKVAPLVKTHVVAAPITLVH